MNAPDFVQQFVSARKVSVPLVFTPTADPAATIGSLLPTIVDKGGNEYAAIQWDFVRGAQPLNTRGIAVLCAVCGVPAYTPPSPTMSQSQKEAAAQTMRKAQEAIAEKTQDPNDFLQHAARCAADTVFFMHNGTSFWGDNHIATAQAIWNLRDSFKATHRTLVVLGPLGSKVPELLKNDVVVYEDPLPGREKLASIVRKLYDAAKLPTPTDAAVERVVDAAAGLSAFTADNIVAMSLSKELGGADVKAVRQGRRTSLENNAGVTIYEGPESFATYGGGKRIKEFAQMIRDRSVEPIKAIAFIDELDKAVGGMGTQGGPGDNTGTAQYQHRALLTNIEGSQGAQGMTLYGVQGCGKTEFVKALANELGVELLTVDLGSMLAPELGRSQQMTASAFAAINAVGQGHVLWIATMNSTAPISTELRRRLRTYGEWYFDLPSPEALQEVVNIYLRKWNLKVTAQNPLPDMTNWTPAEVRAMCYLAYNLRLTFAEAADFIVPLAVSQPEVIARLRADAHNKFRSTEYAGYYHLPNALPEAEGPDAVQQRAIDLSDAALAATAIKATAGKRAN